MTFQKLPFVGFLKLSELPISIYIGGGDSRLAPIAEHPYFRSLKENDPGIFNAYYHQRSDLPTFPDLQEYSWEDFLALKERIRLEGWHPELGPDVVITDGGQLDGTHRLSILAFLFGPDSMSMILDGKITFPVPKDIHEREGLLLTVVSQFFTEKTIQFVEAKALSSQLQAALAELEMVAGERDALLKSNSWRLTKPLRLIKDLLTA